MGLFPSQIMPMESNETYVKHVYLIVIGWTLLVILGGILLAALTL